jgi:hypothetical protein
MYAQLMGVDFQTFFVLRKPIRLLLGIPAGPRL